MFFNGNKDFADYTKMLEKHMVPWADAAFRGMEYHTP